MSAPARRQSAESQENSSFQDVILESNKQLQDPILIPGPGISAHSSWQSSNSNLDLSFRHRSLNVRRSLRLKARDHRECSASVTMVTWTETNSILLLRLCGTHTQGLHWEVAVHREPGNQSHASIQVTWVVLTNQDSCDICKQKFLVSRHTKPFILWLKLKTLARGT